MMDVKDFTGRAARHLAWRGRRTVAIVADQFRFGPRTVWTLPGVLRLGNWLYFWLDAYTRSAAGKPTAVMYCDGMSPWLERFPRLQPLTINPSALRFSDRRKWSETYNQRFGVDFTREEIHTFARDVLLQELPAGDPETLIINVRRGDYYSSPQRVHQYGYDQVGYVEAAIEVVGGADRIRVVSDAPEWCREHLGPVLMRGRRVVEFEPQNPFLNFRSVCGAQRLIGSNSTFSYWGGYVSSTRCATAQIVMPRFHSRFPDPVDAYQLDPDWTIIDGYDTVPDIDES